MGTSPTPPSSESSNVSTEQQLAIKGLENELQVAKSHYVELREYFENLVKITGIAVAIVLALAGGLLYSNLRDLRQDAKEQAGRAATEEAHKRVSEAFEERNIREEIAAVATDKIGKITDKMIEQQVITKLQPFQRRLLLIGRISGCESTMRAGFRDGYDELARILADTQDPEVIQFGKNTLERVAKHYEYARTRDVEKSPGMQPLQSLQQLAGFVREEPVSDLGGVVHVINTSRELNYVAGAFLTFREMSGNKDVKMFDFSAVNKWCASHEAQCKTSPPPTK